MKYELTSNTNSAGHYQIQALKHMPSIDVKKGDLGGYVQHERNLSQMDQSWIYHNACVSGDARIFGNAKIFDDVHICGTARVFDEACIYDNSYICGNAKIHGHAKLFNSAWASDNAHIYGNAKVSNDVLICGDATICGEAQISQRKDYLIIGPIGDNRFITLTKSDKCIIAGCFRGTLDEFKEAVDKKYEGVSDYYIFLSAFEKYFLS